jgi:hypothetical protein
VEFKPAPINRLNQNNSFLPLLRDQDDLDLVILCDTTHSMVDTFPEIRRALTDLVLEVRRTVKNPRIGLVCYKDHGDEGENDSYLTLEHPLSSNFVSVVDFLAQPDIALGEGGGGAEALECALHSAQEFAWRANAHKAVIVIGDAPPHGCLDSFSCCPNHNDYRDEVEAFRRRGIRLYTVLVGDMLEARRVYEWMAAETNGSYLRLQKPEDMTPLFMGITHRECGDLGRYSRSLKNGGRLTDRYKKILIALSA